MNYENYIDGNYVINLRQISAGTLTIFSYDGTITNFTDLGIPYTYKGYSQIYVQKCIDNGINSWGYLLTTTNKCYLVCRNSVDFVRLQNVAVSPNSPYCYVVAHELNNNGNDTTTNFTDATLYDLYGGTYSYYFGNPLNTNTTYGTTYSGSLGPNQVTYFDFTSCWCPPDSYYYQYLANEFTYNSNSYLLYQQHLCFDRVSNIAIAYGEVNARGDIGYSSYLNGYNDGYKNGYDVGISIDRNTANAFSYMEQTFNAIGGIMSLEIIPHVTLGLCFSIPFVIAMITLIFKLVKK